jgi:hypothetical protein
MWIDPCPSDLFMGRLRTHPRPSDSLFYRMGINRHLIDSLMGRMRLFSYAIVPWQVQHCFLKNFREAQQHILMGLQIATTIFL